MAGRLKLVNQAVLFKTLPPEAHGFRHPIGEIQEDITGLEQGLASVVIRPRLQADHHPRGIQPLNLARTYARAPAPDQGRMVAGIGVAQQPGAGVEVGIKQRHKAVGMGQVLLGQLVEVVQDPIGRVAAQHLGPQHAPQQGHQQASWHALAHHIADHQGPPGRRGPWARTLGLGGDEVVVVASHLKSSAAAGRHRDPPNQRTTIRQQLGLNLSANAELAIDALMALHGLPQAGAFEGHPR